MVQENPALIQPLMQQIATSNPQLAQLINQNPQALYDLLGAGAPGEGEGEDDFLGPQVMHVDLTEADAAAVERVRPSFFHYFFLPHPPLSPILCSQTSASPTQFPRLTPSFLRSSADTQLEALGFDRQMVLQAYMLCDKNEELAANFLFDSGDDEMS
jgi:UV excision repair protein RAD23